MSRGGLGLPGTGRHAKERPRNGQGDQDFVSGLSTLAGQGVSLAERFPH